MKYIKFIIALIMLISVYVILIIIQPGITRTSNYVMKDASAIFYTDLDDIDKYLRN